MICFDIFVNGEKLCRAGRHELSVLSTHIDYVSNDDDPLTLSIGGLYDDPVRGRVQPHWIPSRPLSAGDEIMFRISECDSADEPAEEYVPDPDLQVREERKYYEFLKAKYDSTPAVSEASRDEKEKILAHLYATAAWLDESAGFVAQTNGEFRHQVLAELGTALNSILQAQSLLQVGLDDVPDEQAVIDEEMSPELTPEEIQAIDEGLLKFASHKFRKIAYIVGMFMSTSPLHKNGIPNLYYAERVRDLVKTGRLESQFDLDSIRTAEVRRVPMD